VSEVRVHLHDTMAGSYPLRLVDLLFCTDRVVVVEYDYLTGLDLVTGRADSRAEAFARVVSEDGIEAALDTAEHQRTLAYADVERVVVHDGGRFGREKVTLCPDTARPIRVRVHGEVDVEAFVAAVRSTVDGHRTTVTVERGLGVSLEDLAARLTPR